MGRNKQPVRLIQFKGRKHLTKREIQERKDSEAPVIAENIFPPDFLTTKAEKDKFKDIANTLQQIGIMSDLDCDVLGRYILAAEDWVSYGKLVKSARRSLNKALRDDDSDKVVFYTEMLSKYEALRVKAFNQCQTCASSLGLTITSRCKIVVPKVEVPQKQNKFTEYIS